MSTMPERDPAERLDDLVGRMISGSAGADDIASPLSDLLAVAEELRGLPSENFRSQLDAELVDATHDAKRSPTPVRSLRTPRRRVMKSHTVTGGAGLKLHVEETGSPNGKPILFVHGFSACGLVWNKQMHSDLANDFRLVAMDIRGHGLSEKPRSAYGDVNLWADDVEAVITTLGLDRPVLTAWSYGGAIISDYIGVYGEARIAGTNWVGAVCRLGEPLLGGGFIGKRFLDIAAGLFSNDVEESATALRNFVPLLVHDDPSPEDLYFLLGVATIVPPHVREGLFARTVDNDAVVAGMRKPMLLTYGDQDAIVLPTMGQHLARVAKHAKLSLYPNVGHAPFWEAPERFNRELREFRHAL